MELYNKIMLKVWLIVAIVVFLFTTYKCVVEDYRQWVFMYVIPVIAFFMWMMKRWMMRRMEKHLEEMNKK